jgi:hypothetical protein
MGVNFELEREVANYRNLRPEHQARLRAAALRRANAERNEAFRQAFALLVRGARRLGGVLLTCSRLRRA